MDVRAGYKATDVGLIPLDWQVVNLGDVSVISRLAGAEYTSLWNETPTGEIIALRGFNIGQGKIVDRDFVRISNSLSMKLKRSRLCKGDVVYPCVGSIGNAAVIDEDNKYHIQQNIARITPNPKLISSSYLASYLMSFLGLREVERFNSSSSQPSVLVGNLRQYRIALPSTEAEQEVIAQKLTDVDTLIAGLEKLIAKKRDLKQAAMQQLLTGQTRLPGFSGEWAVKRLGDHFSILKNGVNSRAELSAEGGVAYLHYGDIHGSKSLFLNPHSAAMPTLPLEKAKELDRLQNGDLVFADASEDLDGVGRSVEVQGTADFELVSGQHTIAMRFDKAVLADGFKAYLQFLPAFTAHLRRLAAGTKVYATNRSHIASAEIKLPEVDEQKAIASILHSMDTELSLLETRLEKVRQLKQGMMQELLTGKTRLI